MEMQDHVNDFVNNASYTDGYVAVMSPMLFTPENIESLQKTGRLIGIVTLPGAPLGSSPFLSPDLFSVTNPPFC